jgi:hypothetical protein
MPSARLLELAALLHLTALQHGQFADLIRENLSGDGGDLLADGFDALAARLNEISDMIVEGEYG